MPINAHPAYLAAEKDYLFSETKEQKIRALKKMISLAPSHKGAENLRAQLKRRLARLKYTNEKETRQKKGSKTGIRKEDMRAVIVGFSNSGKSSLMNLLTNANPQIAEYNFTTKNPIVGMMDYPPGVQIQIIDMPAVESEYFDRGIVNSADQILMIVTDIGQVRQIQNVLENAKGKQIVVFNKSDALDEKEKRKIFATLQSRRYNFVIVSTKNHENIDELKDKIFRGFGNIRVYTKEPGKPHESEEQRPIIMKPDSVVKEVAEKILKGFSGKIKETRIWGPSSKFPGQKVGLKHVLKDLDIVEFRSR